MLPLLMGSAPHRVKGKGTKGSLRVEIGLNEIRLNKDIVSVPALQKKVKGCSRGKAKCKVELLADRRLPSTALHETMKAIAHAGCTQFHLAWADDSGTRPAFLKVSVPGKNTQGGTMNILLDEEDGTITLSTVDSQPPQIVRIPGTARGFDSTVLSQRVYETLAKVPELRLAVLVPHANVTCKDLIQVMQAVQEGSAQWLKTEGDAGLMLSVGSPALP